MGIERAQNGVGSRAHGARKGSVSCRGKFKYLPGCTATLPRYVSGGEVRLSSKVRDYLFISSDSSSIEGTIYEDLTTLLDSL